MTMRPAHASARWSLSPPSPPACVVGLVVMLWAIGRLAQRDRAGRDRRAVPTDRPDRPDRDRPESQGPAVADLLRLHPLPGRLPDRAVRDVRSAAGDGQGRRPGQRLFRLGRSGARHRRRDEGLSVELRSASEGPDRQPRGGGEGDVRPTGSIPRRCRSRTATTPWITPR